MPEEKLPHPETRPSEVFLTNCSDDAEFEEIGWLSKRRGARAYDVFGNPLSGYRPVFVRKDELARAGVTL